MPLATSLVAYYSLENATDALGSNNLTNNATVTFVTGKVANAGNFVAASSQYLSHADAATYDMGDIDFTITAWMNLASKPANQMGIVSKFTVTSNQRSYTLDWDNVTDRFRVTISPDGTSTAQVILLANNFGAPSLSTYYFAVVRYDAAADVLSICVNDGTPNTTTEVGGAFASTAVFQIGARNTGSFWNGLIDEVGIWKRYLSNAEVTSLYNGGSGRDYAYISTAGAGKAFAFPGNPLRLWKKRR